MKKVNFDVKLPAFVDRIVYVDNYGARRVKVLWKKRK